MRLSVWIFSELELRTQAAVPIARRRHHKEQFFPPAKRRANSSRILIDIAKYVSDFSGKRSIRLANAVAVPFASSSTFYNTQNSKQWLSHLGMSYRMTLCAI